MFLIFQVKELLSQPGTDANIADDENKETALMKAIKAENNEIAKLLIDSERVDINVADKDGEYTVDICCYHGKYKFGTKHPYT